jgi:hypothetical protein
MELKINHSIEETKRIIAEHMDTTKPLPLLGACVVPLRTRKNFFGRVSENSLWIFRPTNGTGLNFYFIRMYFSGQLTEIAGKTVLSGKFKVWKGGYFLSAIMTALISAIIGYGFGQENPQRTGIFCGIAAVCYILFLAFIYYLETAKYKTLEKELVEIFSEQQSTDKKLSFS